MCINNIFLIKKYVSVTDLLIWEGWTGVNGWVHPRGEPKNYPKGNMNNTPWISSNFFCQMMWYFPHYHFNSNVFFNWITQIYYFCWEFVSSKIYYHMFPAQEESNYLLPPVSFYLSSVLSLLWLLGWWIWTPIHQISPSHPNL